VPPASDREGHATLPGHRALRWLTGERVLCAAIVLACLLCAPSLSVGLVADDLSHRKYVLDHLRSEDAPGAWWNMFDVCGRTDPLDVSRRIFFGILPWWTSPDLVIAFLRPLSVASHYLDWLLWPGQPWLMHLHNIAWYALIVLLAVLLYRRLPWNSSHARSAAAHSPIVVFAPAIALLLYAIDEAHVEAVVWIAGRNTLVTAAFVLLTLLLYDRARRDGSRGSAWLAPLALLCAHASSEGAIAVWAYLIAHAIWLDPSRVRARLLALAPLALVTLAWVFTSTAHGYGVRASGLYADPRAEPLYFLQLAAERLPLLLGAQFGIPGGLLLSLPEPSQRLIQLPSLALLALGALVALRLCWHEQLVRFFLAGALGSAVPLCAVGQDPRLLLIVGFGAHGLIVELLAACVHDLAAAARVQRALRTLLAAVLLVLHVPVALLAGPLATLRWSAFDAELRQATASLPRGRVFEHGAIMVLNADSYVFSVFVMLHRLGLGDSGPTLMYVLGTSGSAVRLQRPERNAIVLEPEGGYLLERSSRLVRNPQQAFTRGQQIPTFGLLVTVEETTRDGRPARVRLQMQDGEDPRLLWVAWDARRQRFERVSLPAIGASRVLPGAP